MKKAFCILTLIFSINVIAYSQLIRESISEFAEKLLTLSKAQSQSNIKAHAFTVLPERDLISLGYDRESLGNVIVGIGDRNIICKVTTEGNRVEKVMVGGVRYVNARYMISDYETNGYTMDEEASTRSELIFVKQEGKFNYFVLVEFMVNPNMCMANATFKRVARK